jgi:hypothetical protein
VGYGDPAVPFGTEAVAIDNGVEPWAMLVE